MSAFGIRHSAFRPRASAACPAPSRQTVVITSVLLAGGSWCWLLTARAERRAVEAGFWFAQPAYVAPDLTPPISPAELNVIEATARAELARAFEGLDVTFSDNRGAPYVVRVVQEIRDFRFARKVWVAGESHAIGGLGGVGSVSFSFLASTALAYAPEGADRATLVESIGRGIGRGAVHEFAHQLVPKAPLHNSRDRRSYEYRSADRREQYFGEMHWTLAWPLLQQRFQRPVGKAR